jgi:hypothetical protein
MRKLLVVSALSMITAFLFTTTAMAYDDLITNDYSKITAKGKGMVKAGVLWQTASKRWVNTTSKDYKDDLKYGGNPSQIRIPLKASYGLMDNLEAFAVIPIFSYNKYANYTAKTQTGLGDIWVGAKYGIMPDGLCTIRGALDIPVADDKKVKSNPGGFGFDVGAMTGKKMDKISLDGQAGIRYNAEGPEKGFIPKFKPGLGVYVDASGAYSFTELIAGHVGLEFFTFGKGKNDIKGYKVVKTPGTDSNWIDLKLGACYKINETMGLRGDFIYTLTGKNTDQNLGILVGVGYGF